MNLNPVDLNYTDGTNNYPLQDYIDDKINEIITGEIDITNIDSSNIYIHGNSLSNILFYSDDSNLYIKNDKPFGEIRFSSAINYPENVIYDYGTKIDLAGKLFVYHNYNILQPTFPAGWYAVEDELLQIKADGINTDLQLSVLEGTVGVLQYEIDQIELQLISLNGASIALQNQVDTLGTLTTNEAFLLNDAQTVSSLIGDLGVYIARNKGYTTAKIYEGFKWGLGGAVVGAIGAIGGYIYNQQMSNLAYTIEPNNFTLTTEERRELLDLTSNADKDYTSNFGLNISNLSLEQGFINSNIITSQFIPSLNTNEIKFYNNSLLTYIPDAPLPAFTNGTFTDLFNNFGYIKFDTNGTLTLTEPIICDILVVGAGGRGADVVNFYGGGGGGGAGEVIYYPNFTIPIGSYDIQIGINSTTPSNRITKIYQGATDLIKAIGGGDGGGRITPLTLDIERRFPPKAYNSVSATSSTTFNTRSCFLRTITLNTTGITYGSGLYPIYFSSQFDTTSGYDGHLAFNNNTADASGNAYRDLNYTATTGVITTQGNTYYLVSTDYRGDWIAIKLVIPIAITSYSIYHRTTFPARAPKNFRIYGSNTGTSWTTLQTITNATYTSGVYTDTGLSGNTTTYQYYGMVVNALIGGNTNSTLLNFQEWQINGKQFLLNSAQSGGSGGGESMFSVNSGAVAGTPFDATYSKLNNGSASTYQTSGGNGGSALITGRYTEVITGTGLQIGGGGTGATASSIAGTKTNYGDGGDGNGGNGYQGVILIKLPYSSEKILYNHYTDYTKLDNIPEQTLSKFTSNINGNIYNNNLGNVGIGSTIPSYKLDVLGDINYSGTLRKSGDDIIYTTSNNCYFNSSNNSFTNSFNFTNFTSNNCYLNSSNNCYFNSSNNAFKNAYNFTNYAIANNVNYNNLINEPWINSGTNIYNFNTGNIGINNNTPLERLSLNGIFSVDNGNTTKIIFAYNTTNGYRHSILTNADAGAANNNYIRFNLWNYGQASTTLGNLNALTLATTYNHFHGATNRYTYINDETANKNSYNHTTAPLSLYQRTATSSTVLSQENILHLSREGTSGQSYGARASFTIGRWENNGTNSRTRLDLNISHLQYTDEVNVMSWRSDGRVGINNSAPTVALDVSGAIKASGAITGGAGSLSSLNLNSGNLTNGGTISGTFSGNITGNLTGNADTATKAYRLNPYINEWHVSTDGKNRFNFGNNSTTYFGSQAGYNFRSSTDGDIMTIGNDGSLSLINNLWHKSLDGYNRFYFLNDGHTYFQTRNEFIFRNRDNADVAYISYDGYILANFATVTSARDYIGIDEPNTNGANSGVKRIKVYFGSFTEYHRCFIEDPIFTNREEFLNEYEGRVVVSIGKIKQERRDGEGGEFPDWTILENKEAIRVDDAQPIIQLSRTRKDKRIYGVIGSKTTSYYSPDRIAINGVGEGGIWVVNTNGNVENGDLLQTSDQIGYAEKADDDLIRNSTIGKAVMDCSFDLNSPYYKSKDLGNGIIAGFIACVYMCS